MTEKSTSRDAGKVRIISTNAISKHRRKPWKNRIIRISDIDPDLRFGEKKTDE